MVTIQTNARPQLSPRPYHILAITNSYTNTLQTNILDSITNTCLGSPDLLCLSSPPRPSRPHPPRPTKTWRYRKTSRRCRSHEYRRSSHPTHTNAISHRLWHEIRASENIHTSVFLAVSTVSGTTGWKCGDGNDTRCDWSCEDDYETRDTNTDECVAGTGFDDKRERSDDGLIGRTGLTWLYGVRSFGYW